MSRYRIEVRVKPRSGLLDPEGKALQHALESLNYSEVSEVRVGKVIDIEVSAPEVGTALERVREMCRKLLANPVTEDFDVAIQSAVEDEEPAR